MVVEDLRERVDHMKELSRNAERFAHFNEELTMPEVHPLQPFSACLPCLFLPRL